MDIWIDWVIERYIKSKIKNEKEKAILPIRYP